MTMPILVGTDGVGRMGKSLGNSIGVAESAENQFGKIMSILDEPMRLYFTLLTELPWMWKAKDAAESEVVVVLHPLDRAPLDGVDRLLGPGVNPRHAKEVLGKAIVTQYHGAEAAERVAAGFRRTAGEDPEEISEVALDAGRLDAEGRIPAFVLLRELGLASSGANARRVIEQGGLTIGPNRQSITDPKMPITVSHGLIVRVGKRKIVRVRLV